MSFDFIKDSDKNIHFIGIGGISMSGLAEILLKKGFKVSGSDWKSSHITNKLKNLGAKIYIGHDSKNVQRADLIIYTAAVQNDNPELLYGINNNITTMDRAEFLGDIMKDHKYNVAIAGTHGKTTTTSMLSMITLKANIDPTILVGGELDAINGNVRTGESEYFITEACEYKASFLKFYPYIGVILNIEEDHLDFYKDIEDIENTFLKFAKLIPKEGYLIGNAEDNRFMKLSENISCNILSFGIDAGNIKAKNISYNSNGCASFDLFENDKILFKINLNVPGRYNILNALAAASSAIALNIDEKYIIEGLEGFYGTHRRFELKGEKNGVKVIDDYAHHPTEIKATLSATKKYPHKRVICVFQPHTYSRTITLFNDFLESFYDCDKLILADIYAAREIDDGKISSNILGDELRNKGLDCINLHSFDEILDYLNKNLKEGDLLMTVGAGDVYRIGELYLTN